MTRKKKAALAATAKKAASKAVEKVTKEREAPESENKTVTWRLPSRVAADNAGDWDQFREHLRMFVESGDQLEVEPPEETKHVSFRVPPDILAALEAEAARLSKETGKRYTAGRVARIIWDEWEPA